VGSGDEVVLQLNREVYSNLQCERELIVIVIVIVIPGAKHLFEESGTLDQVAEHAQDWFVEWLGRETPYHYSPAHPLDPS